MLVRPSRHYSAEHHAFRDTVRRFVAREIAPFANDWDEAGDFPRELYGKAAAAGLFAIGFPEAYGGVPDDPFLRLVLFEEMAWSGSGGVGASLLSHTIGAPPLLAAGADLKARVLPAILSGEKISALAITEPGGGSDVAHLSTTARREGDHYVVDGGKIFITSGMRADFYTVAVRTGGAGEGDPKAGISLLLMERDTPGFTRSPLKKMGWWASDTAELHFDACRVPAENLIGGVGQGFHLIMKNFNSERLGLAASACGFAQVCFHDALEWARQRETFGQRLSQHQVIRHKLVDMAQRIEATRAWLDDLAARLAAGESPLAQIAMVKNFATGTMQHCADAAVQILGGMGYMRGTRVERIYREVKVMMIGGGADEVMKDLAARQLGL